MFWRKRRNPVPVPDEIQAELDQTQEWWARAYNDLVRATFVAKPFNPDEHVGHRIVEDRTLTGEILFRECSECPAQLVPRGMTSV